MDFAIYCDWQTQACFDGLFALALFSVFNKQRTVCIINVRGCAEILPEIYRNVMFSRIELKLLLKSRERIF